jgi:hypothetical protein
MRNRPSTHHFWGVYSPLATLSGGSLLVLASVRFSFALVAALSLLWIYILTSLTLRLPFLPRQGRDSIVLFLSAFFGGLYLFILTLISPILAMDTLFFLILSPVCCVSSGVLGRAEKLEIGEGVLHSFTEGLDLSALILALALIREPLGYGTLSLPGGTQGGITLVTFPGGTHLPIRIAASSAGAFFLLGYGIALFRRFGGNLPAFPAAPAKNTAEGGRR